MADLTMKELVQTVLNLQKQVAVLNNTCEALKWTPLSRPFFANI